MVYLHIVNWFNLQKYDIFFSWWITCFVPFDESTHLPYSRHHIAFKSLENNEDCHTLVRSDKNIAHSIFYICRYFFVTDEYLHGSMSKSNTTKKEPVIARLNQYFQDREGYILWMSLIMTFLFGLLLFEPKVSIGGDDSMYINRAYNFIYKGSFPTFQGPLYPIFLGLIIYVFGTKLILFKFISLFSYIGHQWFT